MTAKSTRCRIRRALGARQFLRAVALAQIAALLALSAGGAAIAEEPTRPAGIPDRLLAQAFASSHDGYSTDELLIRDDLRDRFLDRVEAGVGRQLDNDGRRNALLGLLRLRKAGALKTPARRRGPPVPDGILPVAEIAVRVVTDRHRVTTDTLLADPRLTAELRREAERVRGDVDPYLVRKAVLKLRKTRRLRPELVLRVAQWKRRIVTVRLSEIEPERLPHKPGVYLFRDATGYLYVGEASDLARRLEQHLDESHNASLARHLAEQSRHEITVELHVFPPDSPAAKAAVRRAYESELIRSRSPRFNVQP